jgi:hypothetical protein
VELDQPIGLNNGTVDNHCYFACKDKHGVLVVSSKVWLLSSSAFVAGSSPSTTYTYTRPVAQERLVKLDAERRIALKAERAALKDVKRHAAAAATAQAERMNAKRAAAAARSMREQAEREATLFAERVSEDAGIVVHDPSRQRTPNARPRKSSRASHSTTPLPSPAAVAPHTPGSVSVSSGSSGGASLVGGAAAVTVASSSSVDGATPVSTPGGGDASKPASTPGTAFFPASPNTPMVTVTSAATSPRTPTTPRSARARDKAQRRRSNTGELGSEPLVRDSPPTAIELDAEGSHAETNKSFASMYNMAAAGNIIPVLPSSGLKVFGQLGSGSLYEVYAGLYQHQQIFDGSAGDDQQEQQIQRRQVAVRVPRADGESPKLQEALLREAQILSGLKHPNVVALLGVVRTGSEVKMVMQLYDRGSLHRLLASGTLLPSNAHLDTSDSGLPVLPETAMLRVAGDIVAGMCFLAGERIVHRYLASSNILVKMDNSCIVGDLSMAQVRCSV